MAHATSVTFIAPGALEAGLADRLGIRRRLVPVGNTRALTKAQMPENTAAPRLEVRSDNFAVTIDGELVEPQPVNRLPMTQRYFLF